MAPRLSLQEHRLLAAFTAGVRELLGQRVESIVLFGSRARGAGRDDSDLDVFVAVRALTRDERRAMIDLSADLGVAFGLVLSLLAVDIAEFRWDLPLGRAIRSEGVPL